MSASAEAAAAAGMPFARSAGSRRPPGDGRTANALPQSALNFCRGRQLKIVRRPGVDGYQLQEGIPLALLAPAPGTEAATSALSAEKESRNGYLIV